jgi:hypothetical protein
MARAYCFGLQNTMQPSLAARYYQAVAYHKRQGSNVRLSASLPPSLLSHLKALVARNIAQILWNPKYTMPVNTLLLDELLILRQYAANPANPWCILIGLLIPREPLFHFTGDASQLAGGAYSHEFRLWFDVLWSDKIRAAIHLPQSDPQSMHINL